jgi:hypothetical protein
MSYGNRYDYYGAMRRSPRRTTRIYGYVRGFSLLPLCALFLIAILCRAFLVGGLPMQDTERVSKSTVQRTPLEAGIVRPTGYLDDRAGWLGDKSLVESGMKHFYKETGVQPYLIIADEIDGDKNVSHTEADAYVNGLYDELFDDEGHALFLFFEPHTDKYTIYYVKGKAADSVLDQEATDIIMGYFDRYYYNDGFDDSEYFSAVFRDSADRMMTVTPDWRWTAIKALIIVAALTVVLIFIMNTVKAAIRRRQQNIDILNSPAGGEIDIEDEAEKAAKKY